LFCQSRFCPRTGCILCSLFKWGVFGGEGQTKKLFSTIMEKIDTYIRSLPPVVIKEIVQVIEGNARGICAVITSRNWGFPSLSQSMDSMDQLLQETFTGLSHVESVELLKKLEFAFRFSNFACIGKGLSTAIQLFSDIFQDKLGFWASQHVLIAMNKNFMPHQNKVDDGFKNAIFDLIQRHCVLFEKEKLAALPKKEFVTTIGFDVALDTYICKKNLYPWPKELVQIYNKNKPTGIKHAGSLINALNIVAAELEASKINDIAVIQKLETLVTEEMVTVFHPKAIEFFLYGIPPSVVGKSRVFDDHPFLVKLDQDYATLGANYEAKTIPFSEAFAMVKQ